MQLRTVKKQKSKAFNFGKESPGEQMSLIKGSLEKENEVAADSGDSGRVKINF